jgi:hypothetical protein
MTRRTWLLGSLLLIAALPIGCLERSFGRVGPPVTVPPPIEAPLFSAGAEPGTIVVSGSASAEDQPRPEARVSVLNLDLGEGVVVLTGPDALYEVTLPGAENDQVEITVEFDGELFREVFTVTF